MVLHRKRPPVNELDAFDHTVVGAGVADHRGTERGGEGLARLPLKGEAMVLRGHRHPTGGVVDDRDVDAAVPKHHLVGRQAQRAAQDLVAETDAEQRDSGAQHLAGKRDDVIGGGRVAGAVGQEHAMRVEFGDLLEGGRCRQHMAANPAPGEVTRSVGLDTKI